MSGNAASMTDAFTYISLVLLLCITVMMVMATTTIVLKAIAIIAETWHRIRK